MAYDSERAGLRAAYIYLAQDDCDPVIGNQPETSEFALQRPLPAAAELGGPRALALRRRRAQPTCAPAPGITYGNECTEFDLSVSRRYTSSDNLPPSTSIGFSLRLAGIGETGEQQVAGAGSASRAGA